MKKIMMILTIATVISSLFFTSCKKDDDSYYGSKRNATSTTEDPENPTTKSQVFYSVIGNAGARIASGPIVNGATLNFAGPGRVIFYTNPKDTTCVWVMGATSYSMRDQIEHNFVASGTYACSVSGNNTTAIAFTVVVAGSVTPTNAPLVRLMSKTNMGTYWQLQFHIINQSVSTNIADYQSVGSGFMNASWTPTAGNIVFYAPAVRDTLIFTMNILTSYLGEVKFNLVRGSNWFEANLNSLGGVFYDPSSSDNVWRFNFDGSDGKITSYNGTIISAGTNSGNPGATNDGLIGLTVNNGPGQDQSLTIYLKSNATVLRHATTAAASGYTNFPSGTPTSVNTTAAVGYPGWVQVTIPRAQISTYFWFDIGNMVGGNFTPDNSLSASGYWIATQGAFRLMNS